MGEQPEWRWFALVGIICILQSFLDFTPEGPWDSRSFSRGVIGLVGMCSLYVSWFRFTFEKKGLMPTISIWKSPERSWRYVLFFGIICYAFVMMIKSFNLENHFPETTGMIVLLIGTLCFLNSVYVWLVISGPLAEIKADEQE